MKKLTLKNDFHNTLVNLLPKDGQLTASQIKRAKKALCCDGCTCSDDLGCRGPQDAAFQLVLDRFTGKISHAVICNK
jgi:hypothetical protein